MWVLTKKQSKKIVIVKGSCKKCGSCCTKINLCENGKWVTKSSHFKKMVKQTPEYKRLTITDKNNNGTLNFSCTWLNDNNTCKDYDNRLDICRDFPDQMAVMDQGMLPDGCGFEISIHNSFESILQKKVRQEKFRHYWRTLKNWMNSVIFTAK